MIAVAVSTLIVAAALAVFLTITGSLRRQALSRRADARQALDWLLRDLACAVPTAFTSPPPFSLAAPAETGAGADVVFATASIEGRETELTGLQIWRVRYRLVALDEDGGTPALSREASRLDSAGVNTAAATNLLFRGASGFDVSILDSTGWTNRWQPSSRQPIPRAVRVRLEWPQGQTTETAEASTIIPTAQVIRGQRHGPEAGVSATPRTPATAPSP